MMLDFEREAKGHMKELDTDADGSVSKEEMGKGHEWMVHMTHPPHLLEGNDEL